MWRIFPPVALLAFGYGAYLYFGSEKHLAAIMGAIVLSAVIGFVIGKSMG